MTTSYHKTLAIDIETFSDADIKAGVYKYVDAPLFKILLVAYAYDDELVQIIDLARGEEIPETLVQDLTDDTILKTAFNAQFERVALDKHLGAKTGPWECTMIHAWETGIMGGLDTVGKRLGLEEDQQKMDVGKSLIQLFCKPRRPTKHDDRTRVMPEDEPEKWQTFKRYCLRDVEAERAIRDKLAVFPLPEAEKRLWALDQKINDRGVRIDTDLARAAIKINDDREARALTRFTEITGLAKLKSLTAIKGWIKDQTGEEVKTLAKDAMPELRDRFKDYPGVLEVLDIREATGKTSVAKYTKMLDTLCSDGRSRGNIQFFGARTGRWAGRGIQLHNLPQNHLRDLETAHDVVKTGDAEFLELLYDDPGDILRQCIRTAIIPAEGKRFVVADFSAIEARVISWLAGEDWRLEVFRTHGKIYEASASQMFGVPVDQIHKGDPLRQKGKVAELALGYQGGPPALRQMGALKMGLQEAELPDLVRQWRQANPKIADFWANTEAACFQALRTGKAVKINDYLTVFKDRGILFIQLPSGRKIAYTKARIAPHKKRPGTKQIVFEDVVGKKVMTAETYGGKLVENIVQATARDCLAHAMLALDAKGYDIIFHVHDEVIIEIAADRAEAALGDVCTTMGEPLAWAPGLPLRADGYTCDFYQKD
ncbi:DNA polymerase [Peptococcus simiae]|uniref:DNA polymerase n=1 Tax=Peptococcus simiae TaxID=1643805 RepID=UPI00397FA1FC